jgi:uncharacterized protein YfaS (alpha-2-macroglobulin family)
MEVLRDRVVFYVENMPEGVQEFTIELTPRYSGNFVINPAKVESMYFPALNGNNALSRIVIH